jgi:hypothetical protein
MHDIERQVWREARAMMRREAITKAIAKQLTRVQASEILSVSARHMRWLRQHRHFQKPDSATARHPPADPFRPLPGNGPPILQWNFGPQLPRPFAGPLRWRKRKNGVITALKPNSAGYTHVSAYNLMTFSKRTSLNVYEAAIFNCSRQCSGSGDERTLTRREKSRETGGSTDIMFILADFHVTFSSAVQKRRTKGQTQLATA